MALTSQCATALIAIGLFVTASRPTTAGAGTFAIEADVGGIVGARPKWRGSDRYEAFAAPLFSLKRLHIPGLLSIGGSELGFSLAPSVGVVPGRGPGTDARLRGLGSVSDAYELGFKSSYAWPAARVFAELRQGFGGHASLVGGIGADAIVRLSDRTTLEIGLRADLAGDEYMETYFSISSAEAAASGYGVHAASAGVVSVGAVTMLRHELTEHWAAVTRIDYDGLVGDAGEAPFIASAGRHQWQIGAGLTYRFEWDAAGNSPE